MVNEHAALLNRPVTHMTPASLFNRRLQRTFRNENIIRRGAYGSRFDVRFG